MFILGGERLTSLQQLDNVLREEVIHEYIAPKYLIILIICLNINPISY